MYLKNNLDNLKAQYRQNFQNLVVRTAFTKWLHFTAWGRRFQNIYCTKMKIQLIASQTIYIKTTGKQSKTKKMLIERSIFV